MSLLSRSDVPRCVRRLATSAVTLSGHNKWSKIKENKGVNDQQRSKIYGRASQEILNAARIGDSADPARNRVLAAIISKAKSNGVPKANIQAALDRARKSEFNIAEKQCQYEVLFAGKVGLIIECFSDNSTRTLRDLKDILKSHRAQLAPVSFMFKKKAVLRVSLQSGQLYDELMLESLSYGALDLTEVKSEDFDTEERIVEVVTSPENIGDLGRHLGHLGYIVPSSELVQEPVEPGVPLDDETREAACVLIRRIKENPDVHRIISSPTL